MKSRNRITHTKKKKKIHIFIVRLYQQRQLLDIDNPNFWIRKLGKLLLSQKSSSMLSSKKNGDCNFILFVLIGSHYSLKPCLGSLGVTVYSLSPWWQWPSCAAGLLVLSMKLLFLHIICRRLLVNILLLKFMLSPKLVWTDRFCFLKRLKWLHFCNEFTLNYPLEPLCL